MFDLNLISNLIMPGKKTCQRQLMGRRKSDNCDYVVRYQTKVNPITDFSINTHNSDKTGQTIANHHFLVCKKISISKNQVSEYIHVEQISTGSIHEGINGQLKFILALFNLVDSYLEGCPKPERVRGVGLSVCSTRESRFLPR